MVPSFGVRHRDRQPERDAGDLKWFRLSDPITKVYLSDPGLSLGELRITSPEKPYGPLRVGEFPYWQPVTFISPRRVDSRRREPSKCVLADLDFLLIFRADI